MKTNQDSYNFVAFTAFDNIHHHTDSVGFLNATVVPHTVPRAQATENGQDRKSEYHTEHAEIADQIFEKNFSLFFIELTP